MPVVQYRDLILDVQPPPERFGIAAASRRFIGQIDAGAPVNDRLIDIDRRREAGAAIFAQEVTCSGAAVGMVNIAACSQCMLQTVGVELACQIDQALNTVLEIIVITEKPRSIAGLFVQGVDKSASGVLVLIVVADLGVQFPII
jgi:hypothetical protein